MDPFVVILLVVGLALVITRIVAVRRSAVGDVRFVGLFFVPALLGGIVVIWAGLTHIPGGLVIVAIGAITSVLVARLIVGGPAFARRLASDGELPGPVFDYLVWLAVGLPLLIGFALVVLAVTGGLTPS